MGGECLIMDVRYTHFKKWDKVVGMTSVSGFLKHKVKKIWGC